MQKLGMMGAGNIATAISRGIVGKKLLAPEQITVYDIRPEALLPFAREGMQTVSSPAQVLETCKTVLLAVKPQVLEEALLSLRPFCKGDELFISVVAGVSAEFIKETLGRDVKIVLVMPNTPLLIGCGAVALARVEPTTQQEFDEVRALFDASGVTVEVAASQMRECIALNGSSPAFIYRFAQVFEEHAASLGIAPESAHRLFCHSLIGAARMMLDTGMSHQQLIDAVSSKGGTTVAGLEAMEQNGLTQALVAGYDACTRRAYEIGR